MRLLTEPRRPERVRSLPGAPWLAVGTVCVGAFMGQLDAGIVTTALPTLAGNLHASLGGVEWVVLAYVLVQSGSVAAVGRVADRSGRKLLYTYGFGVFVAGSLGCALAPSLALLVAARLVQGAGAALLQANSLALIRDVLPDHRLGAGLGIQGAAQAIGLAAGPALGGALIALGGWRLIFLVNVPAGIAGLAMGWFLLPRSRARGRIDRLDPVGTLLLAAAPAALLAALSLLAQPQSPGWAAPVLGALAVALGALAVLRQRRFPGSVLDAALLRISAFVRGIAVALLAYVVLFGTLVAVPFFLVATLGEDAVHAGLELSALPIALAVAAAVGGFVGVHRRYRAGATSGLLLAGAGLAGLAVASLHPALVIPALAAIGAGMGLFIPANNAAIMGSAPAELAGAAGGLVNMSRGLGTGLGVVVAGLVIELGLGTGAGRPVSAAGAALGLRLVGEVLAGVAGAAALISLTRAGSTSRGSPRR